MIIRSKSLAALKAFAQEVREEVRQVSWPSREELLGSALVVFVGVLLLALFISACDFILSSAATRLLKVR